MGREREEWSGEREASAHLIQVHRRHCHHHRHHRHHRHRYIVEVDEEDEDKNDDDDVSSRIDWQSRELLGIVRINRI